MNHLARFLFDPAEFDEGAVGRDAGLLPELAAGLRLVVTGRLDAEAPILVAGFPDMGAPITAFGPLEDALAPFLGGQTLGLRSIPILAFGNDNLDVEEITSYEIGYSAIIASRLYLTIDYYQSEVENFVTDLLPGVNPEYTGYQPPSFLPAPVRTQILNTLRGGLGANFFGLTNLEGQPTLVLSYANAGSVDTEGADIAFLHLIQGVAADEVRMGMRVRAVWKPREEWGTTIENIDHFRPTGEPDAPFESYAAHL